MGFGLLNRNGSTLRLIAAAAIGLLLIGQVAGDDDSSSDSLTSYELNGGCWECEGKQYELCGHPENKRKKTIKTGWFSYSTCSECNDRGCKLPLKRCATCEGWNGYRKSHRRRLLLDALRA